ncbi:MAG: VanZ family protein [Pseudomonadota bacterium]
MQSQVALKFLARSLTAGYLLLVLYVSLIPFEGWDFKALDNQPLFVFRPLGNYWLASDIVFNILAYIPVSILLFFSLPNISVWLRALITFLITCFFSFGIEYTQEFLPSRVANWLDWLTNSIGAIIGLGCVYKARQHPWFLAYLSRIYGKIFHLTPSHIAGQALIAIWILMHINPAIPPFGLIYQRETPSNDVIRVWIESIQIAFEYVGIGLFFSLLIRQERSIRRYILSFSIAALALKYIGAKALFHPDFKVVHAHQWLGLGIGSAWLFILLWLPPFRRKIAAGVALASAIGVSFLGKDLLRTDIPFGLFNWSYGQLIHFNQLTFATIWTVTTWMIIQLAMLNDTPPLIRLEKSSSTSESKL